MGDVIDTKTIETTIQANGIIRGPNGNIIGRLSEGTKFEDLEETE